MRVIRLTLAVLSLVASAGVGLLAGTVTSASAAPAAGSAASSGSHSAFEPCPCDKPICRPGCFVD
jgi:hypothetical protein